MKAKYNNQLFQIHNLETTERTSINSGKSLKKFGGVLQIDNRYDPSGINDLKEIELINDGGISSAYKLNVKRTSYSNNRAYWEVEISCEEIENTLVEELQIGSIVVRPYQYEEEIQKNALIITLKAEITLETLNSIKEILRIQRAQTSEQYFIVKRSGLMDKEMRFGQPVWSKDEKSYKVKLVLVESAYDKDDESYFGINEPDLSNAKRMISELTVKFNKLFDILVEKKILLEVEENEICKIEDSEIFSNLFDMKKVSNVDTYKG